MDLDRLRFTYEVGTEERMHPDPEVCSRMREAAMSTCEFGCKIYADPRSLVRVLAHNSSYGCTKTRVWDPIENRWVVRTYKQTQPTPA
jgi:hypothetical protein